MNASEISKSKLLNFVFWIAVTLIFTLILNGFFIAYYGNQTTKLLFGLASGGFGNLQNDWFAGTQDPLPLFSFLVQVTYQYLDAALFQIYQIVLIGVFLYSVVQITDHLFKIRRSRVLFFGFLGIYLLLFSDLWPIKLNAFLFNGVASQDLAFNQFLPNIFGVFLFLSLALFLKKKYVYSILSICIAGYFHSGYLISGAVLTSAYMLIEFLETRDYKKVLFIGLLALVLISPVVIYSLQPNSTATVEQVHQATGIIVTKRIPHHTQISVWWKLGTTLQLVLCLAAIVVMRKSKILPVLLIAFAATFFPVPVLLLRPSNAIAILQIWRASVFLIPLSSTLILGAIISSIYSKFQDKLERQRTVIYVAVGLLVLAAAVFGAVNELKEIEQYQNLPERQLYSFIADQSGEEDLYLIPPRDNNLQSFRLETGTPILVNWKSHPWNTLEILEWYDRIKISDAFYDADEESACQALSAVTETYPITHLLTYPETPAECPNLDLIYQDANYLIYTVAGQQ